MSKLESVDSPPTTAEYTHQKCSQLSRDFLKQKKRAEERIRNALKKKRLLSGGGASSRRKRANDNENSVTDNLLTEQKHLHRGMEAADHAIDIMSNTRSALVEDKGLFETMQSGVGKLSTMFPTANELMFKIKKYRNRDSIVIAFTIAVCVFFILIYWLNK